ncbi:hypothetical protein [Nocardioides caldifontis]|uniref:hypothetical protein n=1 Tax=Nocardioides caldifontis TaxID=2588938 RepID=UPI0011DFC8C7|nr:hypothetical protein [Nocardioides caldifontis]
MRSSAEWDWGSWVLGDMADCLRRASELLGGQFELVRACASPPLEEGGLPRVLVVVSDVHTSYRLRNVLKDRDPHARPLGQATGGRWSAQVDDLEITVTADATEEPW